MPPPPNTGRTVRRGPRALRTAAITVTCPEGGYGEVIRAARQKVDLAALGIPGLRPKRVQTGALILEIPGPEGAAKAEALADRMRTALSGIEGVRVARLRKMAELRVRDLDDSVVTTDVVEAVASTGQCGPGDVKVGELRATPNGLSTAWVRRRRAPSRRLTA